MMLMLNTMDAIRGRHSIRKYKPDAEVTREQLDTLLEAAMLAPSACNTRPWEFVVVRGRDMLNKIADAHPYAQMLRTASLAIIVCGLPDVQKDIATGYFPQDCAAATENILLAAAGMGLGTCWCGVYPREERIPDMKRLLGIESASASVPFNVIAVGVPDESPAPRGSYEKGKVRYID
jgi:nitroreductase